MVAHTQLFTWLWVIICVENVKFCLHCTNYHNLSWECNALSALHSLCLAMVSRCFVIQTWKYDFKGQVKTRLIYNCNESTVKTFLRQRFKDDFYLRIRLPGTHCRALRRSWPQMNDSQYNISKDQKFCTNDYATSSVKLSPTFDKTISLVCASVQFILHVTLTPSRSITNHSSLIRIFEILFFEKKKGEKTPPR